MNCPFCNYLFDSDVHNCHTSCPYNRGCTMIRCPNCGYEFVTESKIVQGVQSLIKFIKEKSGVGFQTDR